MTYRHIPHGSSACAVCDNIHPFDYDEARPGEIAHPVIHSRRGSRCPGVDQPARTWLEASGLPAWGDMCDLDKGAALLHMWKCVWEGASYARAEYPCRYLEDPTLVGLPAEVANRHSVVVTGHWEDALALLGEDEMDRLYNLALTADRTRIAP